MKRSKRIAFLQSASAGLAPDGSALPERILLLRRGLNRTLQGDFIVNGRTDEAIAAQVAGKVFDRVMLDFQHNSEKSHPNYQPPPRHHAAVGTPFTDPDGLGMASLEWTPSGRKHAGDYPDLSPAVGFDPETREVLSLSSAALCPQGATIGGMAFFEADQDDDPPAATQTKGPQQMDPAKLQEMFDAMNKRIEALETKLAKAGSDASAALSAADGARTALAALDADRVKARKTAIIDAAKRAGKVLHLSETAIAALSAEDLQAHADAVPGGRVPLAPLTPAGDGGAAALSAERMIEQYNAIQDPDERGAFFNAHRAAMGL